MYDFSKTFFISKRAEAFRVELMRLDRIERGRGFD